MFNTPRTIEEASRQARILERASTLFDTGEYYAYDCGNGIWGVARRSYSNAQDVAYSVDLNARTCTCPDFTKHLDVCKHILGLKMVIDEEASWDAQCREHDLREEEAELVTTGCDPYARY